MRYLFLRILMCIAVGTAMLYSSGFAEAADPVFSCCYLTADDVNKIQGVSWQKECPVHYRDLRLVRVGYWDFSGHACQGELLVHKSVAREIRDIFRELYKQKFPIAKVRLIDEYGGSDTRSMAADNTSAFNYRRMTGSSGKLSVHSYGLAIDINPIENPYVKGKVVDPPQGKKYTDRTQNSPGMIVKGGPVYQAFYKRGWTWGGDWTTLKDYQHFEKKVP